MVSDKIIHKAFRTHKTLWTKHIRDFFFHFHYLPKLYIGFKIFSLHLSKVKPGIITTQHFLLWAD